MGGEAVGALHSCKLEFFSTCDSCPKEWQLTREIPHAITYHDEFIVDTTHLLPECELLLLCYTSQSFLNPLKLAA